MLRWRQRRRPVAVAIPRDMEPVRLRRMAPRPGRSSLHIDTTVNFSIFHRGAER